MPERLNCVKCKHYHVTWDRSAPKGCRLHGFKSLQLPSLVVLQSSGEDCHGFEKKPGGTAEENKNIDLSDDDLW